MKLYVGNISFTITETDLHHIFEQFGSVTEIKVVTDRQTGQPRGFAFVTMNNDAEGRAAIKGLDGKEFGGRPLVVNEARSKEDRPPRSRSRPPDSWVNRREATVAATWPQTFFRESKLASITLLSIFLLSGTIFRNILGRGVERPIVAAEH